MDEGYLLVKLVKDVMIETRLYKVILSNFLHGPLMFILKILRRTRIGLGTTLLAKKKIYVVWNRSKIPM